MEIFGISALASAQNSNLQSAKTTSEQNFVNFLSEIAQTKTKTDVPQVFAGDSKEFEFWLKDEKVASKPFKWRTKDDVMAEIERIIEALEDDKPES
jgi:hypothetical protein